MTIPDPKFRHGSIVYHVTSDQPGVVKAYMVYPQHVAYLVTWGSGGSGWETMENELTLTRPDWESSLPTEDQ